MSSVLGWVDFLLLPLYIGVIYFFASLLRDRYYPVGHPWREHFIRALTLKIAGSIFIVLIYVYYYKIGDTIGYYRGILVKNEAIHDSFIKWVNLVLELPEPWDGEYYGWISRIPTYRYGGNAMPVSVGAVIAIFSFNSFLITSLLFGLLAFTGSWALFRMFATKYPEQIKYIAWSCLYIPSVVIWGSGIFKDTIVVGSLGWLTWLLWKIQKKFKISYALYIGIAVFFIIKSKLYVILAFLPAAMYWIFSSSSSKIKNVYARKTIMIVVPVISFAITLYILQAASSSLGAYSIENVSNTSEQLREDLLQVSSEDGGSGYSLGDVSSGPLAILLSIPKAINVTIFRPYLWEVRKVIVFLNAIESFVFLILFVRVIAQAGLRNTVSKFRTNPDLQFCLIFFLIFSYAVGISTYNFGTLSRYKIPCLPFFGIMLTLLYSNNRRQPEIT